MEKVEAWKSLDGEVYEDWRSASAADAAHLDLKLETDLVDMFGVEDAKQVSLGISDLIDSWAELRDLLTEHDRNLNKLKDQQGNAVE